jgi:hypothetical protein
MFLRHLTDGLGSRPGLIKKFISYILARPIDHRTIDASFLLKLPNELLLIIASFLDQAFKILLSLACKRLRQVLTYLDLTLIDRDTKLAFLLCLEKDHANLQTCLSCVFLFKWRSRKSRYFQCPRANDHHWKDRLASRPIPLCSKIKVTREAINLIFRAQDRGSQYGIPVSFLETRTFDQDGTFKINKQYLGNQELLLATQWEAVRIFKEDLLITASYFRSALCLHWARNECREEDWPSIKAIAEAGGLEHPRIFKCPYCTTDYEVSLRKKCLGRVVIVLKVWRRYVAKERTTPIDEQIFNRRSDLRFDDEALSQRDLRTQFESSLIGDV